MFIFGPNEHRSTRLTESIEILYLVKTLVKSIDIVGERRVFDRRYYTQYTKGLTVHKILYTKSGGRCSPKPAGVISSHALALNRLYHGANVAADDRRVSVGMDLKQSVYSVH